MTSTDHVRRALADRYRLEREIGHGGMATVYLAEDLKHQRRVAIKVLLPELAAMLGEERFLNEIRVTANLQHPGIVPLYDSGAADGFLYYVMPYLDGESLRDRIDREGPLPVDEAIGIALGVAAALAYAHERGVIHRDIKPANIMLQAGVPLVSDFGIALAMDAAADERITSTGLSLGTPSYMSPEQAAGDRSVRATTDVYALACVLYEMLTGSPPFTGPNMPAVIAKLMTERPVPLRAHRDTIPVHVEAAVDKALARIPADRFQGVTAFASALAAGPRGAEPLVAAPVSGAGTRRVPRVPVMVATVALAALIVAGVVFFRPNAAPTTPSADAAADQRPTLAVLSFEDLSPGRDQSYFSDGISEEILSALSRIRDLRVAARSTALTYTGRDLDLRQVGQDLGVGYLLTGSVRKDGDQLRISAELVNVTDGFRLWSQTYDRRLQNVFAIQSEIAQAIADTLRIPLGLAPEDLVVPTVDMTAHDFYLSGRAALRRRGRGVLEAVRFFEASIARDSQWSPAWAGLAEAWAIRPLYEGNAGESMDSTVWATSLESAASAARRALALDPRSSAARVALGSVHRDRWEWQAAEREFLQALELDPDNHEAHTQYAELLWGTGREVEALREAERALALDRAPVRLDTWGFTLYMNRRYTEAEAALEEGIAIDTTGDLHFLRTVLGRQMLFDGRYQEALRRFAYYLPDTAAYRMQGEALERKDASRMPTDIRRTYAQAWMLLGEDEKALDALEADVFSLPFRVKYNVWDPYLAPLHDTPRFRDIILQHVNQRGVVADYDRTAR